MEIPKIDTIHSRAPQTALLLIDPQNDFCLGGSVNVPQADEIVPVINQLMRHREYGLIVLVVQEHPADHQSFAHRHDRAPFESLEADNAEKRMLWPEHCVKGTRGAEVHLLLETGPINETLSRGGDSEVECESAFEDAAGNDTGLTDLLRQHDINRVEIAGLCLDYAVKETALHAAAPERGLETVVLGDASRALHSDGAAGEAFRNAGIKLRHSGSLSSISSEK